MEMWETRVTLSVDKTDNQGRSCEVLLYGTAGGSEPGSGKGSQVLTGTSICVLFQGLVWLPQLLFPAIFRIAWDTCVMGVCVYICLLCVHHNGLIP